MTSDSPRDREPSLDLDLASDPCRRGQADRRRQPTGPLDALRWSGRRAWVRRRDERQGAFFLDRFDAWTLALIVALLGLTITDGVLTLELLDLNSEEFNPLMKRLLNRGHLTFLLGKYTLTAAGLPFVVVFKNYPMFGTRFRVGFLLPVFLGLYLALVAYQIHLLGVGGISAAMPAQSGAEAAAGMDLSSPSPVDTASCLPGGAVP
jgi:hypothetical protein